MVFLIMESKNEIINIVIHGRGGQGAVTASNIIAETAFLSGNFEDVHAYPSFGAERRGAPIQAYAKLSRIEKIWDRSQIENPDIIIILDETVLNQIIASSIKKNGIFIIDSKKEPEYFKKKYNLNGEIKIIVADISKLAIEKNLIIEGAPVVNIPILGLLSKALPEFNLEDLKKVVYKRMGPDKGERNFELLEKLFNLATIL